MKESINILIYCMFMLTQLSNLYQLHVLSIIRSL